MDGINEKYTRSSVDDSRWPNALKLYIHEVHCFAKARTHRVSGIVCCNFYPDSITLPPSAVLSAAIADVYLAMFLKMYRSGDTLYDIQQKQSEDYMLCLGTA